MDRPTAFRTIGLSSHPSSIQGAKIEIRGGKPHLEELFEIKLDSNGSIFSLPSTLYQTKSSLSSFIGNHLVLTALETSKVLVRPFQISLTKPAEIATALPFQAEPMIPYGIEQALFDFIPLSKTASQTNLTFLATRTDYVAKHLEEWSGKNIEPEMVTSLPAALANFASLAIPDSTVHFLIHLSYQETSCVLLKEGKLLAAQSCLIGLLHLWEAYRKDRKSSESESDQFSQLDLSNIQESLFPSLSLQLSRMQMEIHRTLYALSKQLEEPHSILFTGEGTRMQGLTHYLAQKLEKQIELFSFPPSFSALPSNDLLFFAAPIGIALGGLSKSLNINDFRQREWVFSKPWKRYRYPLILYALSVFALAVAFYFFGNSYLAYREDLVRAEYVHLLGAMRKSYEGFEQAYKVKFPQEGEDEQLLDPKNLSQEEITSRITLLEKEIQGTPDMFPLFPNLPKVSDLLAWLANHPQVAPQISPEGKIEKEGLKIESLNYTVVKRPEQSRKQERYQIKVDLEFSSPTPKHAREFHDALITPNEFVDPKNEVKWTTGQGKYRTSFFLKDKTLYPLKS